MRLEQKEEPLRLHFRSEQRVLVEADNEDRFFTTAQEAARACKHAQDENEWREEFEQFLGFIHQWGEKNKEVVSNCYVAIGSDCLRVFVTTRGNNYRFDFDDAISTLDLELVEQFKRCPAETMQLPSRPKDALDSFFSSAHAIQVYGD